MYRSIALSLPLLCALCQAAAGETARDKVLGFSADGNLLVYLPPTETETGGPEYDSLIAAADLAVVRDLRTGKEEQYLLKLALGSTEGLSKEDRKKRRELEARYKALPGKAAWKVWQKEHPLRCAPGKRSPDGKVGADVKIKGKGASGKWGKAGFDFGGDSYGGSSGTVTLYLDLDGKALPSDTWEVSGESGDLSGDVHLCWSPDSRWLAWILHQDPPMMRERATNELRIEPLGRPRVQLVAPKDALEQAAGRVTPAVEKAGLRVAGRKAASQADPRPSTIVYAAAGHEDAAKAIAAAIPGGATVAKLDWRPAFDIVVAVGQSALAKP